MIVHQRIGIYNVIIDDTRVLLSRWASDGRRMWTLPGGGINPGELPEDAARREAYEETGYRTEPGELLGIDSHVVPAGRRDEHSAEGQLQLVRIVFASAVVGGKLRFEQDGSTDRAAWFDMDDLPPNRGRLVDLALSYVARDAAERNGFPA